MMDDRIKKADELVRAGKASAAVTIIKEMLKETPDDPYLHYLLGIARMKCGRFFLAKRALEKANQLLPRHAENLRSLGWVKVMLGQIDEARNDLRDAISLDLMNPLAYIDLAMSYFNYFDFKGGREWLKRGRALSPRDPYVLHNLKTAKEMEKQFSKYPAKERQKMKEEKLDPKFQLEFRISILEQFSFKKPLTKDEAEEVKEEARLNGLSVSIITEKQEDQISSLKNKTSSVKIKEVLKERKKIEKELSKMLKKIKSSFKVEHIKDIIWHEEDRDDLMKIVEIFDRGGGIVELSQILELANNAWNYFPHKSLDGLCPMEKILEYQDGIENNIIPTFF